MNLFIDTTIAIDAATVAQHHKDQDCTDDHKYLPDDLHDKGNHSNSRDEAADDIDNREDCYPQTRHRTEVPDIAAERYHKTHTQQKK